STSEQCTNVAPDHDITAKGQIEGQCTTAAKNQAENLFKGDHWPEIKLAEVEFLGTTLGASLSKGIELGLNIPFAVTGRSSEAKVSVAGAPLSSQLPDGCLRDIDRGEHEHRRVTFANPAAGKWRVVTDIVRPP